MRTIDPGNSGCNPDPLTDPHVVQRCRDEITELSAGLAADSDPADVIRAVRAATKSSAIDSVLQKSPRGQRFTEEQLFHSIRSFSPTEASSAGDIGALVRIHLLSALDAAWWRDAVPFETDDEVIDSAELVDLRVLCRGREINFCFRVQAHDVPRRVMRAAIRRAAPLLTPATIGMKLPYGRPEVVALLNDCALELAARSPARSPRLWVNSMARSTTYQNELRTFGYLAADSSSHCVGWAADIEMDWMRRRGMGALLEQILNRRAKEGQINLIDEGRAWHVCVNPQFVSTLRAMWRAQTGTV